jgi:5'-3' exoribonuclease 1
LSYKEIFQKKKQNMGIKRFFAWLSTTHAADMQRLEKGQAFEDIGVVTDNLMIDMNGIFHNSAQRAYKYGNCKPPSRLLRRGKPQRVNFLQKQKELFQDVCDTIDHLIDVAQPTKRVIMCVDGPAPQSKQYQQRQRRFRSAAESSGDCPFDGNCITPGTKFMDFLCKYVDWHIRKKMTEDSTWADLEIVFSGDKVPGEGEHKLINYMRVYGDRNETFCIHGLDADLVMLSLATHIPNFYILREDMYDPTNEFFCVDIGGVKDSLLDSMRWESKSHVFSEVDAINDFVFMCFTVGNDFLPHIPSIEIAENGLELLLSVYKEVGEAYGHLTLADADGRVTFLPKPLEIMMGAIGHHEEKLINEKIKSKKSSFADPLVDAHTHTGKKGQFVDIEKYRAAYHEKHFAGKTVETVAHDYLEGMAWVLSYYSRGISSWDWCFPYHYAPMASALAPHLASYVQPVYKKTTPYLPFLQLLSVLPPKSSKLIPDPLAALLSNPKSPLQPFCPDKIEIDLAGKMREWEGIVLLPLIDKTILLPLYNSTVKQIDRRDSYRNVHGHSIKYNVGTKVYQFQSHYGDFDCSIDTERIDI